MFLIENESQFCVSYFFRPISVLFLLKLFLMKQKRVYMHNIRMVSLKLFHLTSSNKTKRITSWFHLTSPSNKTKRITSWFHLTSPSNKTKRITSWFHLTSPNKTKRITSWFHLTSPNKTKRITSCFFLSQGLYWQPYPNKSVERDV